MSRAARTRTTALAFVGGVLRVELGRIAAVVAIGLPSALAVTGSLGAMWATGTALNVSSLVGMILIVGLGGLASSMGFSLFGVPILCRLPSPPACAP